MSSAADQLGQRARASLQKGVRSARGLMAELAVSQPTLSRALRTLGADLVPFGAARSIQYALRDATRQDLQAPVYRVSVEGQLRELGGLIPVHPEGFVMVQTDGLRLHTEGLPWWLFDMLRISAIVDACFRLIVDGVSMPSWTRNGCAQAGSQMYLNRPRSV